MSARSRLADRTIVELAATLPGATDVFRRFQFDFCSMLDEPLRTVAAAHDTPVDAVEAAIMELPPADLATWPHRLEPLIGHILARYHVVHRAELPELIALAEAVETEHAGHPDLPYGLAGVLQELSLMLDGHMGHEEAEVFPRLRRVAPRGDGDLHQLRIEHERIEAYLSCLETLTAGHRPPPDACPKWRRLYAGTAKLVEDLLRHRYLESAGLDACWREAGGPSERFAPAMLH
jgi:regulator of cell morphogenesis and NO signaling